jgi:hypothetical protein
MTQDFLAGRTPLSAIIEGDGLVLSFFARAELLNGKPEVPAPGTYVAMSAYGPAHGRFRG